MENGKAAARRARARDRGAPARARGEDRASASATRDDPLLVSVRSGRRGLDARDDGHDPQPRPERRVGRGPRGDARSNPRFAYDSYRRLIQMYGEVVEGVDGAALRARARRAQARARRAAGHRARRRRPRRARRDASSGSTPTRSASRSRRTRASSSAARSRAVFDSWDTPRAQVYRRAHRIPDDLGTAVNVVQMVFGNKGEQSGDRRRVHARPVDRRAEPLRRVPRGRPGRGRRRRDPHARAARGDEEAAARRVRAAGRHDAPPRGALPRRAGHRVHRRGRASSTCCRRARPSAPPPPR